MAPAYGLIGHPLGHSFSPEIHAAIADYPYELTELGPEELGPFLSARAFQGINVTIPYKQAVIPYLDALSPEAARIGAVNTIVNRDGKLTGYNTDYMGLCALIRRTGLSLTGRKVLIFGSGGTSLMARAAAEDLGAAAAHRVSRSGKDGCLSYEEALSDHLDAQILINATPAGMFPDENALPADPAAFPRLLGAVDAVYNPLRSRFVLAVQALGLPAAGGLYMLAAQGAASSALFRDVPLQEEEIEKAYKAVLAGRQNIVLIGMPGSGKSTIARLLAEERGRPVFDTDALVTEKIGMPIREYFAKYGEAAFRAAERAVVKGLRDQTGAVIATGGGTILDPENVRDLKMNGLLIHLDRPLRYLRGTASRPLSQDPEALQALYEVRDPLYRWAADYSVKAGGNLHEYLPGLRKVLS